MGVRSAVGLDPQAHTCATWGERGRMGGGSAAGLPPQRCLELAPVHNTCLKWQAWVGCDFFDRDPGIIPRRAIWNVRGRLDLIGGGRCQAQGI